MLTKSDFQKHIQCAKYLWLYKNRKDLLPSEVDPNLQRIFDDGYEVENYAYKLFPDGVDAEDIDISKSILKTKKLINARTKIIFQPTVTGKNLFCQADILCFNSKNNKWDIYEVKNSIEVKEIHLDDVAFQKMAFEGAGHTIGKTFLVHINNSYIRKGELDLKKLFKIKDITQEVNTLEKAIAKQAKSALGTLKLKEEPIVGILKQCGSPYDCAFVDYCQKDISENSIYSIAGGLSEAKLNKGCNQEMGERYPKYAKLFESVNRRTYDLMDSFKKGYYVHHDFHGSASLKKVLTVIAPNLSYKKLNIQEGGTASNTWLEMIKPDMFKENKDKTYRDLLDYCQLDTLAMVEILEKLERL